MIMINYLHTIHIVHIYMYILCVVNYIYSQQPAIRTPAIRMCIHSWQLRESKQESKFALKAKLRQAAVWKESMQSEKSIKRATLRGAVKALRRPPSVRPEAELQCQP